MILAVACKCTATTVTAIARECRTAVTREGLDDLHGFEPDHCHEGDPVRTKVAGTAWCVIIDNMP